MMTAANHGARWSTRLLASLLVAAFAACGGAKLDQAGSFPLRRIPDADASGDLGRDFHVVAEGANELDPRAPQLFPVFLGDAVLLHPSWVVLGDGRFVRGAVPYLAGARFVFGSDAARPYVAVLRGTELVVGKSVSEGIVPGLVFQGMEYVDYRFSASPRVGDEFLFAASRFGYDPVAVRYGALGGATPPPPLALSDGEKFSHVEDIAATRDGAIMVLGAAGSTTLMLGYWQPGAAGFERVETDKDLHGCEPGHVTRLYDRTIVAVGHRELGTASKPCVEQFDGIAWHSVDGPDTGGLARCYAQEPRGIGWLVTERERNDDPDGERATTLWRRAMQDWERVALPGPKLARTRRHGAIEPLCVWARRDGDIWIQGQYRELCNRGVVLRSVPVREPCRVVATMAECAGSADVEPRGTVCGQGVF